MLAEGKTGPSVLGDGTINELRLDKTGAGVVTDAHGRYMEATYRGAIFHASTQAGVALTAGLGTSATGFILTNPSGSGKNLILLDVCVALTTAPAGIATLGLAVNVNTVAAAVTHTTPLVVRSGLLGAATTAVGLADSAATLPAAPVFIRAIGGGPVATGSVTAAFIKDQIEGSIILQPGTAISTFCLTTAISALISMSWEEVVA